MLSTSPSSSIKQDCIVHIVYCIIGTVNDSCVAFRDKDKKPEDATIVEELIEMSESQGGERKNE